jgi:hypothetical protein
MMRISFPQSWFYAKPKENKLEENSPVEFVLNISIIANTGGKECSLLPL